MRYPGALAVALTAVLLGSAVPAAAEPQGHHHHEELQPASITDGTVLSKVTFTDQNGRQVTLPDGRLWAVTFFYGSCKTVCPRLLYNLSELRQALPAELRDKVAFAAITFDPERDTAAKLVEEAHDHEFTAPNQYVLRGDASATQAAIKAIGFDFKPDGTGGYRHSNLLALVDGQGRVINHFYGLEPNLGHIAHTIHHAL